MLGTHTREKFQPSYRLIKVFPKVDDIRLERDDFPLFFHDHRTRSIVSSLCIDDRRRTIAVLFIHEIEFTGVNSIQRSPPPYRYLRDLALIERVMALAIQLTAPFFSTGLSRRNIFPHSSHCSMFLIPFLYMRIL